MHPYELKDEDEWSAILGEIARESRMTASLTDASGEILLTVGERTPLCQALRERDDGKVYICGATRNATLAMVKVTLEPLVEPCEAGLMRFVIPIKDDGSLSGQITVCGLALPGEEIDAAFLADQSGVDAVRIASLVPDTPRGDEAVARKLAARYFASVND
jgi:ligand-binding sensor protein